MKTNPTSLLRVVIVLAMLGSHASAQVSEKKSETKSESKSSVTIEVNGQRVEAPSDGGVITIRTDGDGIEIDTDGDGQAEERIEQPAADNADAGQVAWLGVKTNEVGPALASQLEIEGGAVVDMIVPGSPADEGGLEEHDVITAVGDTAVLDPDELAEAIRSNRPGDKTTITALRKAKPVELEVTLGNRPAMPRPARPDRPRVFDDLGLDFPGVNPDEIRRKIERMQRQMLEDMNLQDLGLGDLGDLRNGGDIRRMSEKTTSFSDGNGSITITTKNGVTEIEARDADGKLLYKGPAETEEDRKKLPPEVLEKLERFEEMNVDIDIRGFKDKFLPPTLDLPKRKPGKPKRPAGLKSKAVTAA